MSTVITAVAAVTAAAALIVNDWAVIAFFRGVYSRDKPEAREIIRRRKPRRKTGEALWREKWEKGDTQ